MSLSMSTFICPAIKELKFFCQKSKISLCNNEKKNQYPSRKIFCQNIKTKAALSNGHVAITKEFKVPLGVESSKGTGIIKFFEGKNIFVTGGSGFLGKALVEKILRSTPVGKIYVLVKAKDPEAAMDRLTKELINSELFGCVQEEHGKYYQAFIREKLIPVVGNICEPNLGMDSDSAAAIMEEVNVIIVSAAITTLNERYDLLLDTSVRSPQLLMKFAQACKNLELLVHFSTAYVNGENEGIIIEPALIMGENRRIKNSETTPSLFPHLDVADEIKLALRSSTATAKYDMTKEMKTLGLERARFFGWYNAYHVTKAMAEMVIDETRGDVPVLIIRPSVIESCYKEPVPGWIQGNRMFDPIIISYGKGQLPACFGKPDAPMDVIPLDIVVNATIAAIAKHGCMHKSELNVYQMASSVANPLRFSEFFEYIYEYFSSDPLIESESFTRINYYNDLTHIKYFDNFNDFSKYTWEEVSRSIERRNAVGVHVRRNHTLQKQCKARVIYAEHLCKMYECLGFAKARFHAGNSQNLLSEMSKEEQLSFAIDVTKIDWRKYFQEVHIPGLRKYVLNE